MDELKEVKELLSTKLNHSFIKNTIPKPLIDEDKLAMVYFLCSKHDQSNVHNYEKMIAIMLMQIALDTHEHIPSKNDLPLNLVNKQMTVLVGDYYSSLYYYVLSEIDQIELIHEIALSTKIINEHKVNFYNEQITTLEQLYSSLGTIESELFTSFATYSQKEYLVPIINHLFLYNRLLREKNYILKEEVSPLSNYLKKLTTFENKSSILNVINEKANDCIYQIEDSLQFLPYEYHQLKEYINKRLALFDKSYVAEEG